MDCSHVEKYKADRADTRKGLSKKKKKSCFVTNWSGESSQQQQHLSRPGIHRAPNQTTDVCWLEVSAAVVCHAFLVDMGIA